METHHSEKPSNNPNTKVDWCCNEMDSSENYPFFIKNTSLDFPFLDKTHVTPNASIQTEPNASESAQFIDVKSLVIPQCFPVSQQKESETKDDNKSKDKFDTEEKDKKQVKTEKEYKRRKSYKSITDRPPPRRNPRRQSHLKNKNPNIPSEISPKKKANKEKSEESSPVRKSSRIENAKISPLTTEVKHWPVDGMHEKPNYNPLTKRLEKLPGIPTMPKRGGRRKKQTTESKQDLPKIPDLITNNNEEFAACAHLNLHYLLTYVNNVKQFNAFKGCTDTNQANVIQATDMLRDACILYCIANNVSETSLAKYLDEMTAQEDVGAFLKTFVDIDTSDLSDLPVLPNLKLK